jgi:L-seryl-tRNA(Ser) seleniumtransferase
MKVSKEQIVALLTALERFVAASDEAERATPQQVLDTIAAELTLPAVTCRIIAPVDDERPPQLEILLDEAELGRSAFDVCRRLRAGSPPVYVGHGQLDEGKLIVHPLCVDAEDVPLLASRLREELT